MLSVFLKTDLKMKSKLSEKVDQKMEPPKTVLPGKVISFQIVRPAAHVAGQLENSEASSIQLLSS